MAKSLKWTKVLTGQKWASTSSTAISQIPSFPTVVYRTLTNGTRNTSFQIALQEMPELAQSLVIESAVAFNILSAAVFGVNTVKPDFFRVPFSEKSKYEESKFEFDPFNATVAVTFWRAKDSESLSPTREFLDVSTGFELVHRESVRVVVSSNEGAGSQAPMNLEIPLARTISLSPGSYLLVLGFEWTRLDVLTLRLWGQESGTNTAGGKSGGAVKNCSYTPTVDIYPQGKAYMGLGLRRWNGDPGSSIGFGNTFRPATAKVTACIVRGEWGNDIFNPGDVDIAFVRNG